MDHDVNQDMVRFTFQTFIVMHAKFHHDFAELHYALSCPFSKLVKIPISVYVALRRHLVAILGIFGTKIDLPL